MAARKRIKCRDRRKCAYGGHHAVGGMVGPSSWIASWLRTAARRSGSHQTRKAQIAIVGAQYKWHRRLRGRDRRLGLGAHNCNRSGGSLLSIWKGEGRNTGARLV